MTLNYHNLPAGNESSSLVVYFAAAAVTVSLAVALLACKFLLPLSAQNRVDDCTEDEDFDFCDDDKVLIDGEIGLVSPTNGGRNLRKWLRRSNGNVDKETENKRLIDENDLRPTAAALCTQDNGKVLAYALNAACEQSNTETDSSDDTDTDEMQCPRCVQERTELLTPPTSPSPTNQDQKSTFSDPWALQVAQFKRSCNRPLPHPKAAVLRSGHKFAGENSEAFL